MPASKPSRLPSKKRRASSASLGADVTMEKKTSRSSESMTKEQPAISIPAEEVASLIPPVSQKRRLPSKKRKASHDFHEASNLSAPGACDGRIKTQGDSDSKSNDDFVKQIIESNVNPGEKLHLDKKNPPEVLNTRQESPERRQRKDFVERHGGASVIRKNYNDGVPSSNSSAAQTRQRAASQATIDVQLRTRIRSGSDLSLDSLPRPRARSNSQSSMASLDGAFSKRKFSQDGSLDFLGSARKESNDTTNSFKLDALLDLPPPEPIDINPTVSVAARPRCGSTASLVNEGAPGGVSGIGGSGGVALEHLDALGDDRKAASKKRSDSTDDHSSAAETFASSGHRVLMEAIKLSTGEGETGSKGSSQDAGRTRVESWGGIGRDRLGSLGSVLEASAFPGRGRDRLESWGGMSDISINFNASAGVSSGDRVASAAAAAAAAAAAVADQIDLAGAGDELAALGLFEDHNRLRASSVPSRTSTGRDRFNSIASFSDHSFLPEGAEVTIDLNSIVAAAMAHVGDLAELAGVVETVAGVSGEARGRSGSDVSSVASPIIGAFLEGPGKKSERRQRPRSSSTSSKMSVDYEALAAAVDAAHAVSGNLDLEELNESRLEKAAFDNLTRKDDRRQHLRRQLPLKRDRDTNGAFDETSDEKCTVSEKEKDRIRKRARMASVIASSRPDEVESSTRKKKFVPIKKRVKRQRSSSSEMDESASSPVATPLASNRAAGAAEVAPDTPISSSTEKLSKGQASQKWDSMYEALLAYIEERRTEETADFSAEEKKDWTWDGNVPTTFKSADGKALGRWVNNQRSAKSKGTLKADREQRLVEAGLKWSVLASNSWNETLEELRKYIAEQTRDGKEWDGNVPTHYQIKAKPNGKFAGEDKNLGRWVNRQRSMYQAGKLRKDRQAALEKLGLKWSMLSSTSWEAMYETLQEYVAERKNKEGSWDGNVPANFRTTDNPPRALGRWINRQRSAFTKGKLKSEYVNKLNEIGLKWSVHEKNSYGTRVSNVNSAASLENSESVSSETKKDVEESYVKAKTSATLSV